MTVEQNNGNTKLEQNNKQNNFQELFNSIKKNELVWGDIFINQFFDKLTNEEKNKFENEYNIWLNSEKSNNFFNYINKEWLPTTELEFNLLRINFFWFKENKKRIQKKEKTDNKEVETDSKKEEIKKEIAKFMFENFGDEFSSYKSYEEIPFEKIKEYIEKNYEELLNWAKKNWNINLYIELFEQFDSLNKSWLLDLSNLEKYREDYEIYRIALETSYWIKWWEIIRNTFDRSIPWKLEINWDKFTYWDQVIDAWKNPPIKYIKSENWFTLKSDEVDYKPNRDSQNNIIKLSRNIEDKTQEINLRSNRIEEINWILLNIENIDFAQIDYRDINNIYEKFWKRNLDSNTISIFETLSDMSDDKINSSIDWESKADLIKKLKNNIIVNFNIKKLEEATLIISLKKEIKDNEKQLILLKEKEKLDFKRYYDRVHENDEKTRKFLKQYQLLWVDMVWQENLDYIFSQLNWPTNLRALIDLWWWLWLAWKIDIAKWNFGQSMFCSSTEIMVRFLNKLYTWDPTKPISINWVTSWILNWLWENLSLFKARLNIPKEKGWYGFWTSSEFQKNAIDNLKKPIKIEKEGFQEWIKGKEKENKAIEALKGIKLTTNDLFWKDLDYLRNSKNDYDKNSIKWLSKFSKDEVEKWIPLNKIFVNINDKTLKFSLNDEKYNKDIELYNAIEFDDNWNFDIINFRRKFEYQMKYKWNDIFKKINE